MMRAVSLKPSAILEATFSATWFGLQKKNQWVYHVLVSATQHCLPTAKLTSNDEKTSGPAAMTCAEDRECSKGNGEHSAKQVLSHPTRKPL